MYVVHQGCTPRLGEKVLETRLAAMSPAIHAASHVSLEKRVSIHRCGYVNVVMGLRLTASCAAGAPRYESDGSLPQWRRSAII